jgi:hypothetical protein
MNFVLQRVNERKTEQRRIAQIEASQYLQLRRMLGNVSLAIGNNDKCI